MAFYKGLSEKSKIKTSEARSMAFYKGLSEKSKVDGIKTSEARSMAFYQALNEKNKDKRSSFNGILQGIE
ncbi:hypothetical protein T4C_12298 [Trichinella pseudospiralis]|uniref:Uncharacterized protein n=1 Tax=Trichinella pseudospiralis TaxID=6337 RepID=A0A0V1ILD0_TRIPS|nr:hypothetical protein T4C_12298 [Trichinella pseudospiralis]